MISQEEQEELSTKQVGNVWVNVKTCQVYDVVIIIIHDSVKKENENIRIFRFLY